MTETLHPSVQKILEESEAAAKSLSDRQQVALNGSTEEMIGWVFWRLKHKDATAFSRAQSQQAYLVDILKVLIESIQFAEQDRIGMVIANGLKIFLGDEAEKLVRATASAM